MFVLPLFFACSGAPQAPVEEPEPTREPVPTPEPLRAPLQAPVPRLPDVQGAGAREVVVTDLGGAEGSALSLLFSSRGDGDIEPCGCPRQPAGGLARRRTVIEERRAKGPIVLLEGGDSLAIVAKDRSEPPAGQERAKARLIAQEWVSSGLDAAALGEADWLLGRPFVEDLVREGYPATAANLVCDGSTRPFPAARVIDVAGQRVVVVGVTLGSPEGCVVTDPAAAARDMGAQILGLEPDVRVLLWPAREDEVLFAGLEGLPYDFVLDASGRILNPALPPRAGEAWLLGAGQQTKFVGVLDLQLAEADPTGARRQFFPADFEGALSTRNAQIDERIARATKMRDDRKKNATARAAMERQLEELAAEKEALKQEAEAWRSGTHHSLTLTGVLLTDEIADHAPTAARVAAVKATFSDLPDASGAEVLARPMRAPEGSPYAGTAACTSCHAPQYNQWRSTGHARAIAALIKVDRHMDDQCWSCHVTGAEPAKAAGHPVVVNASAEIGGLLNVQCEACHGPAAAHAKDPTKHDLVVTPPQTACVGCHDGVRDEGRFDYAAYLPRVAHPDPAPAQ